MSSTRPCLVLVPGIGDELPIYTKFARRWRRLGYRVVVIPFGWSDHDARLRPKLDAFLKQLDGLGEQKLDIIGVSAGGTAAVLAMASRPFVHRIITVCSPLDTMPRLRNPLLVESIETVKWYIRSFTPEQKQRILSVYALHDPVVHPQLSQPNGVQRLRVAMVLHPSAIYVALMLYTRRLQYFLRKGR